MKSKMYRFLILALVPVVLALLGSCDLVVGNNIRLVNQSSYNVTVDLGLGNTNADGSIAWETKAVSAGASVTVSTRTSYVTVRSWTPSSLVNCSTNSSAKTITFTNK
jgi:hypothetical protein